MLSELSSSLYKEYPSLEESAKVIFENNLKNLSSAGNGTSNNEHSLLDRLFSAEKRVYTENQLCLRNADIQNYIKAYEASGDGLMIDKHSKFELSKKKLISVKICTESGLVENLEHSGLDTVFSFITDRYDKKSDDKIKTVTFDFVEKKVVSIDIIMKSGMVETLVEADTPEKIAKFIEDTENKSEDQIARITLFSELGNLVLTAKTQSVSWGLNAEQKMSNLSEDYKLADKSDNKTLFYISSQFQPFLCSANVADAIYYLLKYELDNLNNLQIEFILYYYTLAKKDDHSDKEFAIEDMMSLLAPIANLYSENSLKEYLKSLFQ